VSRRSAERIRSSAAYASRDRLTLSAVVPRCNGARLYERPRTSLDTSGWSTRGMAMREASLRRPPGSVRRTQTDPFAQHVALDAGAHRHRVVEADQLPRRKPAQRSAIDRSPQHEATRQTARNRSTDPAPARCQCAAVALGHRRVGRAHSRHRGRRSGASRPARAARPGRCGRSHALPPPPPDRRWPAALIGQPVRTKACLGSGLALVVHDYRPTCQAAVGLSRSSAAPSSVGSSRAHRGGACGPYSRIHGPRGVYVR
jgi:hypothetical protein